MIRESRKTRLLALAALLAMTVLAYLPTVNNGYIWDDDHYVTANEALRDADGLGRIWSKFGTVPQYYPLTHTTFWVEHQLWGLRPAGYHIVNALLHAGGAMLWFVLLRRLGLSTAASWLAAAVFALHPVHVESVAWITERKNVLSGLFYLLAALAYLKCGNVDGQALRWRWWAAALLLFVLAMLSKSVAASLPAAVLLAVYWRIGRIRWRNVWPLVPFFAVGVAMAMITIHMEKHTVGAKGPEWALSFLDRWLIAGRALWFYAGKLVWPANLTFNYPRWHIDDTAVWQYGFPVAAFIVMGTLWAWRKRIGRGPLVGVLFFAGTLVPALGFFDVFPMQYSFVADHFQYAASMGLIALAAAAVVVGVKRLGKTATALGAVVAVGVLAALGVATWHQTYMYRDEATLWRETIARNDQSWMSYNNLSALLKRQGDVQAALKCSDRAIAISPGQKQMYNRGVYLMMLGRVDEAIAQYRRTLKLPRDRAMTHAALGRLVMAKGQFQEAEHHFRRSLELNREADPDAEPDPDALHNLGVVLMRLDKHEEAARKLKEAMLHRPFDAATQHALAQCYERLGRLRDAADAYRRAVGLNAEMAVAHQDLGILLTRLRDYDRAIHHLRQAVALEPDDASRHANLAVAMLQAGNAAGAVDAFRKAILIEPDRQRTLRSLAWILSTDPDASIRNGAEAVKLAERANALAGGKDPLALDALAAAYAEVGRFGEAAEAVSKAIRIAEQAGVAPMAAAMQRRLDLYHNDKPYHRGSP